jgi:hypothetical protein
VVIINAAKYAIKIVFKFVKLKNHPQNKKISKSLSVKVKTKINQIKKMNSPKQTLTIFNIRHKP